MRIFVTAGNTQVPIDRVRCITNIFSGRTGAAIALEAFRRGHDVTLATSHPETVSDLRGSSLPDPQRWQWHAYRTFDDLDALMSRHIAQARQDAVIHCAAVSDFRVAGIYAPSPTTHFRPNELTWTAAQGATATMADRAAGKIKSADPELWVRLLRAPKLVDKVRHEWGFRGILVKFKLEVGVSEDELRTIAERSRQHSSADWMAANTLEGAAEWALFGAAQDYRKVTRAELSGALLDALEEQFKESHRG